MNTKAVDVFDRLGNTSPSKKVHEGVDPLWVVLVKIPKHGIIWDVGSGVSLMAAVHRRKFDGISDEEHRKIVEDEVLNTLLRVKLGCPSSHIANSIARTFFPTNS